MTIVASGEISLGGNATTTRSVACELGRSGTAQICMNESQVRSLAARTSAGSAICMNDFYGKTGPPTSFGQSACGGYYTGTVTTPANYLLIVAPNATGCAYCAWKTDNTRTNVCSNSTCNCNNGYWATFTYLNNTTHPAGNFAATVSAGGFSDWYMPAINELNILYNNKGSMPAGEGYTNCFSVNYWATTENFNYGGAFSKDFLLGGIACLTKTASSYVRAVRRVPT